MPLLLLALNRLWARVFIFVLVFFNVATRFNYLDAHNFHLYLYGSFILLFFMRAQDGAAWRVRFCQVQVLLVYFISGLWKLGAVASALFSNTHASVFDFLRYSIAEEYLNSNTVTPLGRYIVEAEHWSGLTIFGTMGLEVGSLAVVFFPRLYPLWGLLLVTFHSFTKVSMGLYFRDTQLIVACFLIMPTVFGSLKRDRS
jgi:hypothetical protein